MRHTIRHTYNVDDYLALEDYLLRDQNRLLIEYHNRLESDNGQLEPNNQPDKPGKVEAVRVAVGLRQIYKISK